MFKNGHYIFYTLITFVVSYNFALIMGDLRLFDTSNLKLICNFCIFGFSTLTSIFGLKNDKSKFEIEWLKISICTFVIVFVTISINNIFEISNIRWRLFTFDTLVLVFSTYFILKADNNANI